MARRPEQVACNWKNVKASIGVITIHWKNLVVVTRFKGHEAEPGHDFRGARGLREGDEDAKIEGQTCWSLP
jgi:hypothetical protein